MILVLAPHMDDEIYCAGYIARFGDVHVHAFSHCDNEELTAEWIQSCLTLGVEQRSNSAIPRREFPAYRQEILDEIVALNRRLKPTCVLCPASTDTHQDHRVVYEEALRAFRDTELVLGYECPRPPDVSKVNITIELSAEHLATKLCAWECYKSQQSRRQVDWAALATTRGFRCASGLAEGYELLSGVQRL